MQVLCGGSVVVRGKSARIGCFLLVCGWVLCGGWGSIPLVRSLRVSGSRVTCSKIPVRCPQIVLRMKSKCTSVFHRAVRVRFVPYGQDFLENLTHLSLFPFENGDKIAADGEAGLVWDVPSWDGHNITWDGVFHPRMKTILPGMG